MKRPPAVDREELRAIVREEIRALFAFALAATPEAYTTRRGCGPVGWSDELWKRTAPTIPGATKPGRWTIVPRPAFEAWERSSAATPPLPPVNDAAEAWSPRAALESVGLRRTR